MAVDFERTQVGIIEGERKAYPWRMQHILDFCPDYNGWLRKIVTISLIIHNVMSKASSLDERF